MLLWLYMQKNSQPVTFKNSNLKVKKLENPTQGGRWGSLFFVLHKKILKDYLPKNTFSNLPRIKFFFGHFSSPLSGLIRVQLHVRESLTVCPRSLDPFYYTIKTSLRCSTSVGLNLPNFQNYFYDQRRKFLYSKWSRDIILFCAHISL